MRFELDEVRWENGPEDIERRVQLVAREDWGEIGLVIGNIEGEYLSLTLNVDELRRVLDVAHDEAMAGYGV